MISKRQLQQQMRVRYMISSWIWNTHRLELVCKYGLNVGQIKRTHLAIQGTAGVLVPFSICWLYKMKGQAEIL